MNKTTKTILWVIVTAIIIGGVWYGVSRKSAEEKAVKIGVILPLTGSQAAYGQGVKEGLDLALSEIEGVRIQLIYEDNAGEVKNSVTSAQKLIDVDKAIALITVVSQSSVAIAPVAQERKIVVFSMASQTKALNDAGDYVFKSDDDLSSLGEKLAQKIFDLGYKDVGIIFATYNDATVDAEKSFVSEFNKLGGKITASEGFSKNETDFRSYLTKIKLSNPPLIFMNGLQGDSGLILKQIRELGMEQPVFSNGTVEDPQVINAAGQAAEGVIFATFQGFPSQDFVNKIQAEHGHYPLRWSVEAYDGLKILASALSNINGEITPGLLKDELSKIKNYDGESGSIKFDESGNAKREMFMKTIKNGRFIKYEE